MPKRETSARGCTRPCGHCRKPSTSSARLLADFGLDEAEIAGAKIFGPGGCSHCHYTGYRGRQKLTRPSLDERAAQHGGRVFHPFFTIDCSSIRRPLRP